MRDTYPRQIAQRSIPIDLAKGFLTVGMVLAHVIQLLGNQESKVLKGLSQTIDLVSFSGFLFCFGYAAWLSYLQKPELPWGSIARTSLKCYLAYVISGIAYRILVSSQPPDVYEAARIATLRDMPEYSGFLLSFALITIFGAVFRRWVGILTNSRRNLLLGCGVCLLFTLMPSEARYDPIVGVFIGGHGYSLFPIAQYGPLFLLGVFSARNRWQPDLPILVASCVPVAVAAALFFSEIKISRFPPSAIWIVASAGLFNLYFGLAHLAFNRFPASINSYLNAVGQNVLLYLLLSNMVLFTCHALGLGKSLDSMHVLLFHFSLMAGIFFVQFISVDLRRAKESMNKA